MKGTGVFRAAGELPSTAGSPRFLRILAGSRAARKLNGFWRCEQEVRFWEAITRTNRRHAGKARECERRCFLITAEKRRYRTLTGSVGIWPARCFDNWLTRKPDPGPAIPHAVAGENGGTAKLRGNNRGCDVSLAACLRLSYRSSVARKPKALTREQLQARKDQAVRFTRDVVGDADRADEIASESLEDLCRAETHPTVQPN